jgi:hypothetical protein
MMLRRRPALQPPNKPVLPQGGSPRSIPGLANSRSAGGLAARKRGTLPPAQERGFPWEGTTPEVHQQRRRRSQAGRSRDPASIAIPRLKAPARPGRGLREAAGALGRGRATSSATTSRRRAPWIRGSRRTPIPPWSSRRSTVRSWAHLRRTDAQLAGAGPSRRRLVCVHHPAGRSIPERREVESAGLVYSLTRLLHEPYRSKGLAGIPGRDPGARVHGRKAKAYPASGPSIATGSRSG